MTQTKPFTCQYKQEAACITKKFDDKMKMIQRMINKCGKELKTEQEILIFNLKVRDQIIRMVKLCLTSGTGMEQYMLQVGMGGSHVWINNGRTNSRIAIFYIK